QVAVQPRRRLGCSAQPVDPLTDALQRLDGADVERAALGSEPSQRRQPPLGVELAPALARAVTDTQRAEPALLAPLAAGAARRCGHRLLERAEASRAGAVKTRQAAAELLGAGRTERSRLDPLEREISLADL